MRSNHDNAGTVIRADSAPSPKKAFLERGNAFTLAKLQRRFQP